MNKTQAFIATALAAGLSISAGAFAKDATPSFAEPSAIRCCAAIAVQSKQSFAEPTQVRCCADIKQEDATLPELRFVTIGNARIFW